LDTGGARPLDGEVEAATRGILVAGTILNTPLEAA